MGPTTLEAVLREEGVSCVAGGLEATALPSWIVPGEDRLSYVTLVRLVECCREHHWRSDIVPRAGTAPIDSITKSFRSEFLQPVLVGSPFAVRYRVTEVRSRGYGLEFQIIRQESEQVCARFEMGCVFYDPEQHTSVAPPAPIAEYLKACLKAPDEA